ncbi:MAG TPA: helix-turn-helix domain-containing protein [Thermomicrobiales bacterium]|nr:helix-turn-helix domain-containing protein [Thermomicrobiales bacterium]
MAISSHLPPTGNGTGDDSRPSTERGLATTSVADVLRHSLPEGSTVLAGHAGLQREVTWASRLRPTPPAFEHLAGGELVLLPPDVLELLDERLTIADAIHQLSSFAVAAVAVSGDVHPADLSAAEITGIPLISLPTGASFGTLERATSRYIAERRRDLLRRGQEAGRQLMEVAIAGESLADLARELSNISGRIVAIDARDGRLLASASSTRSSDIGLIETALAETRGPVSTWLRIVATGSSAEPPSSVFPTRTHLLRVVAPVSGRDGLLGSVSLLVPVDEESAEDALFASRGAAACAVTMTRELAAASARREIELNVLDEILDGALRSEISLLQQVTRLGHDLDRTYCTIIARVDASPGSPARARDGRWAALEEGLHRAARSRGVRVLWRIRNASAEIVWPVSDDTELAAIVKEIHGDLTSAIAGSGSSELISMGVGRIRSGLDGIRQSHQDARQALTIGRRLHGPGNVTLFERLGVYRLIYAAEQLPELQTFQQEALGTLVDYDRQHGADLIHTLEAFFAANCSPKEAAALLQVHRNTVLYRLERIAEITGLDLNSSDVRLRLHLALHVRLALSA